MRAGGGRGVFARRGVGFKSCAAAGGFVFPRFECGEWGFYRRFGGAFPVFGMGGVFPAGAVGVCGNVMEIP